MDARKLLIALVAIAATCTLARADEPTPGHKLDEAIERLHRSVETTQAGLQSKIEALQKHIVALQTRVKALEERPVPDPVPEPPVEPGLPKLVYRGAIRVPHSGEGVTGNTNNGLTFAGGGGAPAFRPSTNTLWMQGHSYESLHAELTIPDPVISDNLGDLNTAALVQPFGDLTGGLLGQLKAGEIGDMGLASLEFVGPTEDTLLGVSSYYDATASARTTHILGRPDTLNPQPRGVWRVGQLNAGNYADFTFHVPAGWQGADKFPPLMGGAAMKAIIGTRSSTGPAAHGFDYRHLTNDVPWTTEVRQVFPPTATRGETLGPYRLLAESAAPEWVAPAIEAQLAAGALTGGTIEQDTKWRWVRYRQVPATTYLNYPAGKGTMFGGVTDYKLGPKIADGAFVGDYVLQIGTRPKGLVWYGTATRHTDGTLVTRPDGTPVSNPCGDWQGVHSEGLEAVVYVYRAIDLISVQRGERLPHEIEPIATRVLDDHPTLRTPCVRLTGAPFDAERNLLYVVQYGADRAGAYWNGPLIHVYEIKG